MNKRAGRYKIIRKIAMGGTSEIFLAQEGLGGGLIDRNVVIKKILPQFSSNDFFKNMILREARLLAALNHSNIVQVFDAGLDEAGYPFMVLEHIEGYDLKNIFSLIQDIKENLSVNAIFYITEQLLRALIHLHELRDKTGKTFNLIHRDLSPNNIMCSMSGDVKLLDFGLTKKAVDVSIKGNLTGKVPYLSPEQVAGSRIDARSDIYSLGVVIIELMTGKHRFENLSEMEIISVLRSGKSNFDFTGLSHIPSSFIEFISRAVRDNLNERYQSSREMLTELMKLPHNQREFNGGRSSLIDFMDYYYGVTRVEMFKPDDDIQEEVTVMLHEEDLSKLPMASEVGQWDREIEEQTVILRENATVRTLGDHDNSLVAGGGMVVNAPYNEVRTPTEFYRVKRRKKISSFLFKSSIVLGLVALFGAMALFYFSDENSSGGSSGIHHMDIDGEKNGDIYIDGKKRGTVPLTVELSSESGHEIEVKKKGFFPWRKKISQGEDIPKKISVKMRPWLLDLEAVTGFPGTKIRILTEGVKKSKIPWIQLPAILKDLIPGSTLKIQVKFRRKHEVRTIKLPERNYHRLMVDPPVN
ncbi:MAG: serine/threonine protein kinase [Deltaproteobacteria bacterium]|nr:serine/threonine protein kinase [Deltaproteobacteria bacterium]